MWTASFRAMGTDVQVSIAPANDITQQRAQAAFRSVRETIAELESKFSRFRSDSELSHVNAQPGKWIGISFELAEVLHLAKEAFHFTGGRFHPCMAQIMEQIGYGESFERLAERPPTNADTQRPIVHLPVGNQLPYVLSRDLTKVYLSPGYKIDLGGIAKGWIVDRAAEQLRSDGILHFILSAGGDMICAEDNAGQPWHVGIEHPFEPGKNILILDVTSSCVATSGTYRRTWKLGSETMHHIVDPEMARPAQTDVISCTVVTANLVAAEVYAKTCLLLGSEAGIEWLSKQPQRGWVIVKTTGEVVHSWDS